ncbi:MAG TPA: hydrogenase maturation nickel metallochaperone HypA [Mycobacteriales bacterium]|jgi:hydrogenase nickel incorporation protein HypA/HybF
MHEVGLCEGILDAVERRAAGRKVTRVRVRMGVLHRVSEPALQMAFSLVAAGSVAEEARVDLVTVPLRAQCRDCGEESESDDPLDICPACGSTDLQVDAGDEMLLESISLAGGELAGAEGG